MSKHEMGCRFFGPAFVSMIPHCAHLFSLTLWMEVNMRNERKCMDNLRMSPDNLLHLHDILLGFGLKGTRETGSLECLGIYVWTCAHNQATRRSRDRF